MTPLVWYSMAGIIISILVIYALMVLIKLRAQTNKREQLAMQIEHNQRKRNNKVFSSILLISKAVSEKQCDISEGCWRLSVLIESLPEYEDRLKSEIPAIFNLYNQIKHMPILDARKTLSKKEKLALDLQRMEIEQELEQQVFADIEKFIPFVTVIQKSLTH